MRDGVNTLDKGTDQSSGCAYLGFLSLIASLAGAALAAMVYTAMHYSRFAVGSGWETAGNLLLATGMVFYFGAGMAVPIGLLLGIPLLASSRRYLHHTVLAALVFAILGLLGGLAIKHFGGSSGLGGAEFVFGACVGGMHPLLYGRANGVAWSKIYAALLLSAMIVPSVAYAGEDVWNATESRHEFEKRCTDIYGSMAVVRDRADMERWGIPPPYDGKWQSARVALAL